jgi:hypothetical protein
LPQCRESLKQSLIFHKECQYFERGIPSSYLRHTGF